MLRIENVIIDDFLLDFEIFEDQRLGIFSKDPQLTEKLLLILAGIMRTKGKVLYQNHQVYDNEKYFKSRIYLDCKANYLKTLNIDTIGQAFKNKYQKTINIEKLKKHIDVLKIRGECEITSSLTYQFTPTGNTLINLSLAFSLNDHLLINNPTINITRTSDLSYIMDQFKKRKGFVILGINSLLHLKDYCDRLIIFSDFKTVQIINPREEKLLLIDNCDIIEDYKLFNISGKRMITRNLPQETTKRLQKQKIKIERINVYEIEKYF